MAKEATTADIRKALKGHTDLTPKEVSSVMRQLEKGIFVADESSHRIAREIRKTFTHLNKGEETVKLHSLYSHLQNS